MKKVVVVTRAELAALAVTNLLEKPQFRGKHVAEVAMVIDPDDVSPERRVRCEVVIFDQEKTAREYAAGNPEATDAVPTTTEKDQPNGK